MQLSRYRYGAVDSICPDPVGGGSVNKIDFSCDSFPDSGAHRRAIYPLEISVFSCRYPRFVRWH